MSLLLTGLGLGGFSATTAAGGSLTMPGIFGGLADMMEAFGTMNLSTSIGRAYETSAQKSLVAEFTKDNVFTSTELSALQSIQDTQRLSLANTPTGIVSSLVSTFGSVFDTGSELITGLLGWLQA